MITVQVLFFATVRAIIGMKELKVNLPPDSSVLDLKRKIVDLYPHTGPVMESMLVSVNRVFSDDCAVLPDQAEVAFFPHISGG
jgi:molybdopterin converting factor small subunit